MDHAVSYTQQGEDLTDRDGGYGEAVIKCAEENYHICDLPESGKQTRRRQLREHRAKCGLPSSDE